MATFCSSCGEERVECPRCEGRGIVDGGISFDEYQCPNCKGKGEVCPKCGE